MDPGIARLLTPEEVEEVFASAQKINKYCAWWWDSEGEYHRDDDLPALVWKDGGQHWYLRGNPHRGDGLPACISADGTMAWFEYGVKIGDQDNLPLNAIFPNNLIKSASKI